MAFWNRATQVVDRQARAAANVTPAPLASGLVPSWDQFQGMRVLWAMQVPAYKRGVTLISGTVAQLPVSPLTPDPVVDGFLSQPEAGRTEWVTMQRTVRDMVNHGRAFWRIVGTRSGRVTVVRQVDADTVTVHDDGSLTGPKGEEWAASDPDKGPVIGRVIVIDGFRDGALVTGVDVLSTAYAQEAAARVYADAPMPAQILKNVSNYELSDTEITGLIDAYVTARQASSVAYLNAGVELDTLGWDATQTALVAQRNESAIQIARLLNLDPIWVGASVAGVSTVYQNRVDLRQDLVDLTLADYMVPLEQRLSMRDVCGVPVRFDTSEFLRANLTERSRIAVELTTAGIITTEQARAFVSDRPTGGPA